MARGSEFFVMLEALARLSRGGNYCRPVVLLPPQFPSLSKADEATRGRVECGGEE